LIRHASSGVRLALTVISLTITVVGLAILCLLILAIRLTPLLPSSFLTAVITAVSMPTIATAADVKHDATPNTPSLPKNTFGVFLPHPHPVAGWTSRAPS
jgi:hypothetical protein